VQELTSLNDVLRAGGSFTLLVVDLYSGFSCVCSFNTDVDKCCLFEYHKTQASHHGNFTFLIQTQY